MSSNDIAIRVENLSKCYEIYANPRDRLKQFVMPRLQRRVGREPKQYFREFWALKDVSFEVKKGETVGIIGRNGSGKSTLLQMICGTLNPTSGSIQTNGRIAALLELGSGFNPEFTGRENVYMNASVLGLSNDEIDTRFDDIAAFADIGDFIDQPVKTYSSGMAIRLAFAVAVAVQPDVLVVDEALSVGDEGFQRKCFMRIEEIKQSGGTILFVTHSTQLVVEMCNRAILLDVGELSSFETPHLVANLFYKTIFKSAHEKKSELIGCDPNKKNENCSIDTCQNDNNEIPELEKIIAVKPTYDPLLISPNRHELYEEKYGVTVSNISLQNLLSEEINVVIQNHRFVISFDVEFRRQPKNVVYQVLFKTTNGIPIAGDRFSHEKTFDTTVSLDIKNQVIYEFNCLINPGVYFISIEVCGDDNGENVVYHKFAEILAFRVLAEGATSAIGFASLMARFEMKDHQK